MDGEGTGSGLPSIERSDAFAVSGDGSVIVGTFARSPLEGERAFIWDAEQDGSGSVWVATRGGLSRWDRATDRFLRQDTANVRNIRVSHERRTSGLSALRIRPTLGRSGHRALGTPRKSARSCAVPRVAISDTAKP